MSFTNLGWPLSTLTFIQTVPAAVEIVHDLWVVPAEAGAATRHP